MRRLILATLFFAIAAMAINTTPYFPIAMEYEWIYEDSSNAGYDTVRSIVSGTTTIHGHETFIVTARGLEGVDSSFYQIRSNGFYEMLNMRFEMADIAIENYPVLFMKNPLEIGESWAALSIDTSMMIVGFPVTITIDVTAEFEGFEDLVLPIGNMRDCMKITAIADWKVDAGVMFSDSGVDLFSISYYAENIGLVSHTEFDIVEAMTGGAMEVETKKLISYDFTNIEEQFIRPERSELSAFPNPFNSAVNIRVPDTGVQRVEIFDLTGKLIESLTVQRGTASVGWEPSPSTQSGIYLIKAITPTAEISSRVVYMK